MARARVLVLPREHLPYKEKKVNSCHDDLLFSRRSSSSPANAVGGIEGAHARHAENILR